MTNPWMSMWLSAANSWAGAMRGFWTAEMHRQQTQMLNEMSKQMTSFWLGGLGLATKRETSPTRRQR